MFRVCLAEVEEAFAPLIRKNVQPEKEIAQWAYSRAALSFLCSTALSMS